MSSTLLERGQKDGETGTRDPGARVLTTPTKAGGVAVRSVAAMEPLWSPVVATGGKRSQIRSAQKPQEQAKTVATSCYWLPEKFHGKEGVDGSSPSEGLKYLQIHYFRCLLRRVAGDHYGGGHRGRDLQGFLPTPGLVLGTKGNSEGTRAFVFGRGRAAKQIADVMPASRRSGLPATSSTPHRSSVLSSRARVK
jgi:hypothetical protein